MIKKEGEKWVLYTKDGSKKLGEHDSEADAKKQEAAIEASKHRAAERVEHYRALSTLVAPETLARKPSKDEHPFTYCMQVVIPAIEEKQGAVDDPEAFCGWWKSEHEYEAAQAALTTEGKEARQVHLVGATGQMRTATFENREYMVVPVVALMEGVIHAINAETPEFVPLACLACAPQGWNGRPVVLGHPVENGRQISANSPTVLESQSFGTIFGAHLAGKKLALEAWIDPVKAERIGATDLIQSLREGKMCEVSVGAFVVAEQSAGMYGDKSYKAVWRDIVPDHLAFLPKGIGACSTEMGCGAPRTAMAHLVTAEGLETLAFPFQKKDTEDWAKKADEADQKAEAAQKAGDTDEADKQRKLAKEYRAKLKSAQMGDTPSQAASEEKAELIAYQTMRTLLDQLNTSWEESSKIVDDLIMDETVDPARTPADEEAETEVETARLESVQVLCMSMYSTLNALMSLTSDCLQPEQMDSMAAPPRYMAGARHSSSDRQIIQRVHDHAVSLGADCSGMKAAGASTPREDQPIQQPTTAEGSTMACSCGTNSGGNSGGRTAMTTDQRKELITALISDKHSGFVVGDEKLLEAASDERLDSFRVAAAARAKEVEQRTQQQPAATERSLTEEEFMKAAPESIKTLLARAQAQDTAHKAELVSQLKTAQSEYSESELSAMSIDGLERLARVAGVNVDPPAVNYGGRAIPRAAAQSSKDDVYLNPPDPYAEGLKALRGETAAQ